MTQFDVFARKEHQEPLLQIGSIEAENAEAAKVASLETFGPADEWLEMLAVPREAVVLVFSEHQEVAA